MAECIYNNDLNANISCKSFALNCGYYPRISYKENLDLCSKSKTTKKLFSKLYNQMAICQPNLYHAQDLQKQAHNKEVKLQSYIPGNKGRLSSKYLKTKQNCKLETKFLYLF